jgi:hypothetical protein
MRFELKPLTLASFACTTHRALFQLGASATKCDYAASVVLPRPIIPWFVSKREFINI